MFLNDFILPGFRDDIFIFNRVDCATLEESTGYY